MKYDEITHEIIEIIDAEAYVVNIDNTRIDIEAHEPVNLEDIENLKQRFNPKDIVFSESLKTLTYNIHILLK